MYSTVCKILYFASTVNEYIDVYTLSFHNVRMLRLSTIAAYFLLELDCHILGQIVMGMRET